jgi:hypothetical protein
MKDLTPIWDGETGSVYRFQLRDGATIVDQAACAVEFYVYDEAGTFLSRRAGVPVSPKSGGYVDLSLLGREIDWMGEKNLILKPKIYMAVSPTGSPASNLLLTPSFDTDGDADGIADNWALQGAKTATWALTSDDTFPPVLFGSAQRVKHAGLADPDFVQQAPAVTLAVGDRLSAGVWARHTGTAGAGKSNGHALFFKRNAGTSTFVQFEVTERDWYFVYGSLTVDVAQSSAVMGIDARGTTLDNRFDDAFFFKGDWRTIPVDPLRIRVRPRPRVSKNMNLIQGVGGFEEDSNGDGLADGISKVGSGSTLTIEKTPANVYSGRASQKAVLSNQSNHSLRVLKRGRFLSGEVWAASVRVLTSGALTGGGGSGGFGIKIGTQEFDGAAPQSATTNFGTSLAVFTQYIAQVTLNADRDALVADVLLNGQTGTIWIDDLQIYRVTP